MVKREGRGRRWARGEDGCGREVVVEVRNEEVEQGLWLLTGTPMRLIRSDPSVDPGYTLGHTSASAPHQGDDSKLTQHRLKSRSFVRRITCCLREFKVRSRGNIGE